MRAEDITESAVLGAGTMGAGIALCFAQAGVRVRLMDVSREVLDRGLERLEQSQRVMVSEGLISERDARAARERVSGTTELDRAARGVQYVLEAAPEDLELKREMFGTLERICDPKTILASNTSGLAITRIAARLEHPQRVGGMHWVNPPEIIPLVEVIKGERTSAETAQLIYDFSLRVGKVPVMINKESPGFGMNRLQFAVLREAFHLVEQGYVSAQDVDRIMRHGLGMRYSWLGPFETADLGGLALFNTVGKYLIPQLCHDTKAPRLLEDMVAQGKEGIRSGEGFYSYPPDAAARIIRKRNLYFLRQQKLAAKVEEED